MARTNTTDARTKTARTARPRMTAEDATNFAATSNRSALQVVEAIDARRAEGVHTGCTCEPYADVFTFNRWRAMGLFVQKGEKALRIASFVPVEGKGGGADAEGATADDAPQGRGYLIPKTITLFCRCQVAAKGCGADADPHAAPVAAA